MKTPGARPTVATKVLAATVKWLSLPSLATVTFKSAFRLATGTSLKVNGPAGNVEKISCPPANVHARLGVMGNTTHLNTAAAARQESVIHHLYAIDAG